MSKRKREEAELFAERHLVVALIGRPNVGKSTLFNRLVGRRQAIVDPTPGLTVDRHYGKATFYDCEYTVIDTGGLVYDDDDEIMVNTREQTALAVAEADILFVLFDGRSGASSDDEVLVSELRKVKKPVYYLVNKIDGPKHEALVNEYYELGVSPLFPISAEHAVGVGEFLGQVEREHPSRSLTQAEVEGEIAVAVIGKPNIGKSTLVNRLLGEDRHVVSDVPGTTRDAIDSLITRGEKVFRLIDTAGIRRQAKIDEIWEKRIMVKALKAMDRAQVALIMIDAGQGVTEQDTKIAGFAHEKGLASIVVANKWDLVEKDGRTADQKTVEIRDRLKFIPYAPVIFTSASSGQRIEKLLQLIESVDAEHAKRIGTGELNRWLKEALAKHPAPTLRGKPLKIYYISQVANRPPTFMLVVNDPERLHFSYERYLQNQLRETFDFTGTPLKFFSRTRSRNSKEGDFEGGRDD